MTHHTDAPDDKKNLKWALGAVTAVAVLATVLAAVLLFGGGGSGDPKAGNPDAGSNQDAAAGIASAHDTTPVSVITEDPSCTAWTSINSASCTSRSTISKVLGG